MTPPRFAHAVHQHHLSQQADEFAWLYAMIADLRPSRVLEIGTLEGGWLYAISDACAPGATLVAVDCDSRDHLVQARARTKAELARDGFDVHFITGDSGTLEVQSAVRSLVPVVDLLHIDGDHEYDGCRCDYDTYAPLVRPGGMIVFHDAQGEAGVAQVFREISSDYDETHFFYHEIPGQWVAMGIGVVRVPEGAE